MSETGVGGGKGGEGTDAEITSSREGKDEEGGKGEMFLLSNQISTALSCLGQYKQKSWFGFVYWGVIVSYHN